MAFLQAYMREGRCGKTTAPKGARTCSKQPTATSALKLCYVLIIQNFYL